MARIVNDTSIRFHYASYSEMVPLIPISVQLLNYKYPKLKLVYQLRKPP